MAYQLPGGGVAPDLSPSPPEGGEQAPPPAAEGDRISTLPEEVRRRILGSLPLKKAVMLGMASKSWRGLVTKLQRQQDFILGIHIGAASTEGPRHDYLATHVPADQSRGATQAPRDVYLATNVPADHIRAGTQAPPDDYLAAHLPADQIRAATQAPRVDYLAEHLPSDQIRAATQAPLVDYLAAYLPSDQIAPLLANDVVASHRRGSDHRLLDGGKRRRADEEGGQNKEEEEAEAEAVFPISDLPEDLRRRILTHVPLKDAIRTGALAQDWRDLWKSRWMEPTSCLDIIISPGDKPMELLHKLESEPPRRLDRLSVRVDNQRFRNLHLKRVLAYAAECRVEDLRIDLSLCKPGERFMYHLPLSSPLLAHLSLRNINLSEHYCKDDTEPFFALEVIHLHSVTSSVNSSKILELCPNLRILELRRCSWIVLPPDCQSLRSFRFSGNCPCELPPGTTLTDIYISFGHPIPSYSWNRILPDDFSRLTILSMCSHTLKVASSLLSKPNCRWNKLPSLQELQLLMHETAMENLADIYLLMKSCHFSDLERLFVQLPATSDVLWKKNEEVTVELPGDNFINIQMVKIKNFNWRPFEVELVSVLLRNATTSVPKVLLVSPSVDPIHVPGAQETDLLILKDALSGGRIVISECECVMIRQFSRFILKTLSRSSSLSLSVCSSVSL